MTYHLFLDDERLPGDVTWVRLPNVPWQLVRNYDEFVETVLEHGLPEFVTFDHDLADAHYAAMLEENESSGPFKFWMPGDEENPGMNLSFDYGTEKTGYDCAKWLVEHCMDNGLKYPAYEVHSMNPVGAERIRSYIENAKKHTEI